MRGIEQIPWIYDALCHLCERGGFGPWRLWLASGARGRTLDLGCGTGRNLPLLPPGARTVALDPSPEALARARRRAPTVPLVQARAEALPFRDGTFDTILSGLVFCSRGGRNLAHPLSATMTTSATASRFTRLSLAGLHAFSLPTDATLRAARGGSQRHRTCRSRANPRWW